MQCSIKNKILYHNTTFLLCIFQDKDGSIMRITSKHGQQYQCVLPIVHFETKESSTINVTTEEINKLLQPLNNTCLFQVRIQNSLWIKVAVVILCALTSNSSNTRMRTLPGFQKVWVHETWVLGLGWGGFSVNREKTMFFESRNTRFIFGEKPEKNRRKIRILLIRILLQNTLRYV